MRYSRRRLLEAIVLAPLAVATGGCCRSKYARPLGASFVVADPVTALLRPDRAAATPGRARHVIDAHAHFFNASDVPVRGFVADCLGHKAPPLARPFLKAIGLIADRLADRAPTAAEELKALDTLIGDARRSPAGSRETVRRTLERERDETARRLVDAIRGSEFDRLYRNARASRNDGVTSRSTPLTPDEVRAVVAAAEAPLSTDQRHGVTRSSSQNEADVADGLLGFLFYMLSYRWTSLDAYKSAYTSHPGAFGICTVLGALVDFDYWLDCPPRSPHDDQLRLHALLRELHAPYFKPVAAYNPWTDINQDGEGLARVIRAWEQHTFAAVKIYPPMGFRPAGNAIDPPATSKSRPDLKDLDAALARFFAACTERRIPIIAHTARSNGRDHAHDEFGGPAGWKTLLSRHAAASPTPIIDFGHFGGGPGTTWTQEFAELMASRRDAALYGDLGYWDELVCPPAPDDTCTAARTRLRDAMRVAIGQGATVGDRTMFATDWLMLSQMKRWADYPFALHDSISTIASAQQVEGIFGGNAARCFNLEIVT